MSGNVHSMSGERDIFTLPRSELRVDTTPRFRVVPLSYAPFAELFERDDVELASLGARRVVATHTPGFPCRVSLEDAEPGEEVLLLHWEHHPTHSPYRAAGPIYVRRRAKAAALAPGELPLVVTRRLMSLRAYDANGFMIAGEVRDGADVRAELERQFANPDVSYVHLHNAKPGCFSCAVERVEG
jgi:Protein of unknown function (DUF1203)